MRIRRATNGISARSARQIRTGIYLARERIRHARVGPDVSKMPRLTFKAYVHTLSNPIRIGMHRAQRARRMWKNK